MNGDEQRRSTLDRPLGLDGPRRGGGRPLHLPSGRSTLLMLIMVGLFGASAAISLREQPFRTPSQAVAAVPVETAAQSPTPQAPPQSGGAQIIKVPPQNGGIVIRDPSSLNQDLRTAHLPDRALIEDSPEGPLPVRGADGRRPFDAYARPWSGARGARVAIVLGGLAVSQTGTQAAIAKLPAEVTLAFASGGNSIDRWMQQARQKGHEIVMQVPLEPFDYPNVDPGRNTLTADVSADENSDRLHWVLSRTTNYTGVMNYMGGRFMTDRAAMEPFIRELGERGLMFLDDGSSARSLGADLSASAGTPFAAGDVMIDSVRERGDILARLDDLERTARAKGFAVGIGSAFDVTVDTVTGWVQEARRRGIEIVPISAVAADPERG
ncbi:MAG TPA: divergent polysaccharide deacetylase family protein [Rhizobiaceae bacterium]|nr:divergent polysaccharide deacetylase family protein [Rhizobiaceae bacterium]